MNMLGESCAWLSSEILIEYEVILAFFFEKKMGWIFCCVVFCVMMAAGIAETRTDMDLLCQHFWTGTVAHQERDVDAEISAMESGRYNPVDYFAELRHRVKSQAAVPRPSAAELEMVLEAPGMCRSWRRAVFGSGYSRSLESEEL